MTHKETKIVSQGLCFKEGHHLQADGTQREQNSEPRLVFDLTKTDQIIMSSELMVDKQNA
jgi:hypothetical protein